MGVLGAKEYGNRLAQTEASIPKASLVIEIDRCTSRLYDKLNEIVATTTNINDRLLCPAIDDNRKEQDIKEGQGWLESHLEQLEVLFRVTNNIIRIVSDLEVETKTDIK